MITDTREATRLLAEQLLAEKVKPTAKLIRQRLGKGSLTTIQNELDKWWNSLAERADVPDTAWGALPPKVIELCHLFYREATAQAYRAFKDDSDQLRGSLATALTSNKAALTVSANATERIAYLERQLEEGITREKLMHEQLTSLATERTEALAQLSAVQSTISELHTALDRAQSAVVDAEARASDRFKGVEQRMLLMVDEARQDAQRLRKEIERQKSEMDLRDKEYAQRLSDMAFENKQLLDALSRAKAAQRYRHVPEDPDEGIYEEE